VAYHGKFIIHILIYIPFDGNKNMKNTTIKNSKLFWPRPRPEKPRVSRTHLTQENYDKDPPLPSTIQSPIQRHVLFLILRWWFIKTKILDNPLHGIRQTIFIYMIGNITQKHPTTRTRIRSTVGVTLKETKSSGFRKRD